MKRKTIAFITALALSVSLVACSNQTNNADKTDDNTQTEQTEKETVVLTDYVKGLKDWTVEINAKNVDFMDGVTYDKEVVKEVTADDSKVDLSKEGKYDLVYSIVPTDDSISKETVIKTVTVNVVSIEKAQEEADKGNQVVTDGGEIKKDSNGNTPKPPKEEKPVKPTDKPSKPDNGNKPSKPTDKPSKPDNKPEKPADKPDNGNGGGNNQGNDNNNNQGGNGGNTQPPKHEHSYSSSVTIQPTHEQAGTKTFTCKCGDHYTESIPATGHSYTIWVDPVMGTRQVEKTREVPVYETVGYYKCKKCGAEFDNVKDCGRHCTFECNSRYEYKTKDVQTGTKTETYYETEEYVKTPGYYKCSCGKHQ